MKPLVAVISRLRTGLNAGGVEAVVEELVPRLQLLRPDWDVRSVYAYEERSFWSDLPFIGDFIASTRFWVKSRSADAILLHGTEYAFPLALSKRLAKKTIAVWHGTREFEVRAQTPRMTFPLALYIELENWVQRLGFKCRAQAAITPHVVSEMQSIYGRLPAPVAIIPNGVPQVDSTVPADLGENAFSVVWSGTSAFKKGLDIAVEACRQARGRIPSLTLHVLGQCAGPAAEPWIRWHGMVARNEARSIVAAANVFLSTARYEGFSIAILEALSLGTPVIASPASGWLITGVGAAVADYEPSSYASALCQAFAAPPHRSELLARASEYRRKYSWDAVTTAYANEIAAVLERPAC